MTTEQASGAATGIVLFLAVCLIVTVGIGAAEVVHRWSDRRADVRLARSRDCCAAHGLDVYGGDE